MLSIGITENEGFNEMKKTFNIKVDENNFLYILDTKKDSTYNDFYGINLAII